MNHKHPAAISQTMNGMFLHGDAAVGAVKFGEQIAVVTWDVNSPGAFAEFAQNLLDDVIMLLRPVNAAPQLPDVDQVAHHIERFNSYSRRKSSSAPAFAPRVPRCTSEIHTARTRRTKSDSRPNGRSMENRGAVKIGIVRLKNQRFREAIIWRKARRGA